MEGHGLIPPRSQNATGPMHAGWANMEPWFEMMFFRLGGHVRRSNSALCRMREGQA